MTARQAVAERAEPATVTAASLMPLPSASSVPARRPGGYRLSPKTIGGRLIDPTAEGRRKRHIRRTLLTR